MVIRNTHVALLIVCLLVSLFPQQQNQPKKTAPKPEIYYDEELDMTVAPCTGALEFIYIARPKLSVEKFAVKEKYKYVINASYFSGTRMYAQPTGWLKLDGKKIGKLSKSRQLTHIVGRDTTDKKIQFQPWKKFRTNPDSDFEFQSGPMVIENSTIAYECIHHSLNGRGKYTRSLLAVTASNKVYFITIRNPVSLTEAAEKILCVPVFKKQKVSVINLDGGASVAFYSKDYPNYNYNTEDRLPLMLCVK